jgi:hypothetical protein
MPIFRIKYTTARTNHGITEELEWVTDSDWDSERTRACFQARHPDAAITAFQQLTLCPHS